MFHLHVEVGTRSGGQSARAAASYAARCGRYRNQTGEFFKGAVSGHMPLWALDGSEREQASALKYWHAADEHERINGVLFRCIEIALPDCMSDDERRVLVLDYAEQVAMFDEGHLPYTLGLHAKLLADGVAYNNHAHIIFSERINDGIERSPELWFRRASANREAPESGGARKAQIACLGKSWIREIRRLWANIANKHLSACGYMLRIDHRSLRDQGVDRLPTIHVGFGPSAIERKVENASRRALNERVADTRHDYENAVKKQDEADDRARHLGPIAVPATQVAGSASMQLLNDQVCIERNLTIEERIESLEHSILENKEQRSKKIANVEFRKTLQEQEDRRWSMLSIAGMTETGAGPGGMRATSGSEKLKRKRDEEADARIEKELLQEFARMSKELAELRREIIEGQSTDLKNELPSGPTAKTEEEPQLGRTRQRSTH